MIFIFFIYGLAFFTLGLAIFLYPKKDSVFNLANKLWLIAAFGIIHGINEWIDMFTLITKPGGSEVFKIVGLPVLVASYLFLLEFGVGVITETKKKYSILKVLPAFLFIVWIAATVLSSQRFLLGSIWARYLLGAPGIFLTAYALFLQVPQFKDANLPGIVKNVKLAIAAFFCYGIFSGLIVPKAGFFPASVFNYTGFMEITGIPVQLFRAVCAVVAAFAMIRVLSIFEWETKISIRNAKEFTENILNTMQDGLIIIDRDCTIKFMNKIFLQTFGKEVIGKKCYEVLNMDKEKCNLCPSIGYVNLGETKTVENSQVIKNKFFLVSQTNMRGQDGSLVFLEVFRDITKLKELERMKEDLTHMIIHDLNNPLMGISVEMQLLKMDGENFSQEQREKLDMALLASEDLKRMINNLLDISKMEEGKLTLRYEGFQLGNFVKEVVEQMSLIAQNEDKIISLEVGEDMPDISADKEIIKRVISNLLNNAIKYSPLKATIFVKAFFKQDDKNFYIQVKDFGEGVPEEYLDKIFDKFAQLEDRKAEMGHGLGLTFCKMAVEAHGGKIWVESEPGKGSTFYFTIPLKRRRE